jgi:2-hydroxy-6-oxonona-2,4-dienedioate hydrolase
MPMDEADTAADPLDSRWAVVDGIRVHARAGGRGAPVVLVHGYGLSCRYMLPLAEELAPSFSVYAPDLPGHGRSEQLPGTADIGGLAAALGRWLDETGLERPALVANSMGCQVATELAVRLPERVGPLVLIGPTIDPARRSARHQLLAAVGDSTREPLSLLALVARDDVAAGFRTLLATARACLADRIEDRLPAIEQPTVVVRGGDDWFVGAEWAERTAALLPRGRLVTVPGEPHAVHYTRPALVAEIVRGLLAGTAGAADEASAAA